MEANDSLANVLGDIKALRERRRATRERLGGTTIPAMPRALSSADHAFGAVDREREGGRDTHRPSLPPAIVTERERDTGAVLNVDTLLSQMDSRARVYDPISLDGPEGSPVAPTGTEKGERETGGERDTHTRGEGDKTTRGIDLFLAEMRENSKGVEGERATDERVGVHSPIEIEGESGRERERLRVPLTEDSDTKRERLSQSVSALPLRHSVVARRILQAARERELGEMGRARETESSGTLTMSLSPVHSTVSPVHTTIAKAPKSGERERGRERERESPKLIRAASPPRPTVASPIAPDVATATTTPSPMDSVPDREGARERETVSIPDPPSPGPIPPYTRPAGVHVLQHTERVAALSVPQHVSHSNGVTNTAEREREEREIVAVPKHAHVSHSGVSAMGGGGREREETETGVPSTVAPSLTKGRRHPGMGGYRGGVSTDGERGRERDSRVGDFHGGMERREPSRDTRERERERAGRSRLAASRVSRPSRVSLSRSPPTDTERKGERERSDKQEGQPLATTAAPSSSLSPPSRQQEERGVKRERERVADRGVTTHRVMPSRPSRSVPMRAARQIRRQPLRVQWTPPDTATVADSGVETQSHAVTERKGETVADKGVDREGPLTYGALQSSLVPRERGTDASRVRVGRERERVGETWRKYVAEAGTPHIRSSAVSSRIGEQPRLLRASSVNRSRPRSPALHPTQSREVDTTDRERERTADTTLSRERERVSSRARPASPLTASLSLSPTSRLGDFSTPSVPHIKGAEGERGRVHTLTRARGRSRSLARASRILLELDMEMEGEREMQTPMEEERSHPLYASSVASRSSAALRATSSRPTSVSSSSMGTALRTTRSVSTSRASRFLARLDAESRLGEREDRLERQRGKQREREREPLPVVPVRPTSSVIEHRERERETSLVPVSQVQRERERERDVQGVGVVSRVPISTPRASAPSLPRGMGGSARVRAMQLLSRMEEEEVEPSPQPTLLRASGVHT
ncbi:hypothetical protein KIPB_007079 [Kipferlia bialata]|uniref:Uncharacterized protein n=1 Tax=Kipferlia bialata TaxID=797122 RepID=A0A9K3D099_9EUKA|nr:hypothetical protein KIPB_007079 [Kipferlia bialata]|eukprot:g7079.t1